ncbi:Methyltransferase domain-containing protein [Nitrosomonas cryotolerans]|uniref:Methyltransferase domain-containing protein n=1 Tax=Nitrosomonas cryotolerans ATCC 49181 TaxID=1131553 RepID=A0A1N6I3L3_9PROT|nr:class I SAM-dependent methyltransferase [Nitrosomonas cryotolerans]SFP59389.1 Methyltransferase domain-containing protein [Nitrosomonas cryotolerans]SIO26589.1 Methyltransferase domain-containing protein [Nitrosomonas cryotolerans ATCC 49181]
MIPWRIKAFFSEHFPLGYHLLVNLRTRHESEEYWNYAFDVSWQAGSRDWPTKNRLVKNLTSSTDRILDVGCGTGAMLRYLKEYHYTNLEGLEISSRAVEVLGEYGITMHHARLPDLPLPEEQFDVIVASQVLEHIIPRRKFLHKLQRLLKPTGSLIIFVPDNCLGPIDEPSHVTKFTKESLTKTLSVHFSSVFVNSMKDENFEMPILFAYAQNHAEARSSKELTNAVAAAQYTSPSE